ncbi:hypothetical protein C2G38_2161724 [Gigaspora rosea]|uniref:Uncharacterized protein n=1 Tax=Gigaspora rosea TaxID=44941 RepID=A0A397VYG7_9GLOM|nr:hypothetical protein C2G38_2161724 [Gigaspora rosea]
MAPTTYFFVLSLNVLNETEMDDSSNESTEIDTSNENLQGNEGKKSAYLPENLKPHCTSAINEESSTRMSDTNDEEQALEWMTPAMKDKHQNGRLQQ